jgi:hypothetical protein
MYWTPYYVLVSPTWLLHWFLFLRFEPALVPHSLARNLPLYEVLYVCSCSPICACAGELLRWLLDRVCLTTPFPLLQPICMMYLLYIHMCDGECEHL